MAAVLVVEDNEALRKLVVMLLEQQGHHVLSASNGLEGLMVYTSYRARVDLVLTDIDMPQMDASPGLFTVMAAINAAGYKAEWSSPNNHPIRAAIQEELAKRNIPSLSPLKEFFESHRKRTDAQELSQYISFALSCTGPPSF